MANKNTADKAKDDVKVDWDWKDTFLPDKMEGKIVPGKDVALTIDAEFKAIIPPINPKDKDELRKAIIREGCLHPIVVWKDGDKFILLDGHNRKEICNKESKPYSIRILDFPSRNWAKEWIIRNQFARRNLCNAARVSLALILENTIKGRAKANQSKGGKGEKAKMPMHTREVIADIAEVSGGTVDAVKDVIYEKDTNPNKKVVIPAKNDKAKDETITTKELYNRMIAGSIAPSAAKAIVLHKEVKRKAVKPDNGDDAPSPSVSSGTISAQTIPDFKMAISIIDGCVVIDLGGSTIRFNREGIYVVPETNVPVSPSKESRKAKVPAGPISTVDAD